MWRSVSILALGVAGLASAAAAAEKPTLLGVAKNWSAYQATTSDGKVCYALSKPRSIVPVKVARDPIYLLVSDWPERKVHSELEVVPGYSYKDGEPVMAQAGSEKIEFFTRNDGEAGSAWVKDPNDEARMVAAMRKASTVTISGVSQRGTHTKDTYSLSGISAMLDLVHNACSK